MTSSVRRVVFAFVVLLATLVMVSVAADGAESTIKRRQPLVSASRWDDSTEDASEREVVTGDPNVQNADSQADAFGLSKSRSPSRSRSPSSSMARSVTPSASPSESQIPSVSASLTLSPSESEAPSTSASNSILPSESPSASPSASPDPFTITTQQMLLAFQAQQLWLSFWYDITGTYSMIAVQNISSDEAGRRFTEIVRKYATADVNLQFPSKGLNLVGNTSMVLALRGQLIGPDGGNAGEHHVSSFPYMKSFSYPDTITLALNDVAYVHKRNNSLGVFLGRKTFTAVRQAQDSTMRLSYVLLEVRSSWELSHAVPLWDAFNSPFNETASTTV